MEYGKKTGDIVVIMATVMDVNGNPISDASVKAFYQDSMKEAAILQETDEPGIYRGAVENNTNYTVTCIAIKYQSQSQQVSAQKTSYEVQFTMELSIE